MAPKPSDLAKKSQQLNGGVIHVEDLPDGITFHAEGELAETEVEDQPEMFRTFTDQAVAPIGVPT